MSRVRKLCKEINDAARVSGCAFLTYNNVSGVNVTTEISCCDAVIMTIFSEISEEMLLDLILMRWESECAANAHDLIPSYLLAIRERLWGDYNVD